MGAVARDKGCEVKIISKHTQYHLFSDKDIVNIARKFKPDIIGMMVYDEFSPIVAIYALVKKLSRLNIPIIGGGPHATILPEELLNNNFNVVVVGEGENTFAELIDYYQGKKKNLKKLMVLNIYA